MNYGYLKVATGNFDVKISNVSENVNSIISLLKEAQDNNTELMVFPELSLTGYSCQDLFLRKNLHDKVTLGLNRLKEASGLVDFPFVVGAPIMHDSQMYNCAVWFYKGEILAYIPKCYIPNNQEFYEKRWFASGLNVKKSAHNQTFFGTDFLLKIGEKAVIGCEICEDLWVAQAPSIRHCINGAEVIVNLSASNDIVSKRTYRRELVKMQSAKSMCGYVYISSGEGESTTDIVFSGHSIITCNGTILQESVREAGIHYGLVDVEKIRLERIKYNSEYSIPAQEDYFVCEIGEQDINELPDYMDPYPFVPGNPEEREQRCKDIMSLQAIGLYERLKKTGMKKVVIGISGGLDSTLALLVIREAYIMLHYDMKDIIAITMPGFGTSNHTKTNSDILMEKCGVTARTISIKAAANLHMEDIGHAKDVYDVTYENIQARERTQILMDVANQENALVIGTGDLSEIALGWCTYNGDHMSMYAVNSSIPKTLVKYLVSSYAMSHPDLRDVLLSICDTMISPELLPLDALGNMSQSTEGTIGKYDLHDFFLYHFIRNGFSKEKIQTLAEIAFPDVSKETIENTLNMFFKRFFTQQFKRSCMPDGPKVGSVSLSPRGDFRMPSDASFFDWI